MHSGLPEYHNWKETPMPHMERSPPATIREESATETWKGPPTSSQQDSLPPFGGAQAPQQIDMCFLRQMAGGATRKYKRAPTTTQEPCGNTTTSLEPIATIRKLHPATTEGA